MNEQKMSNLKPLISVSQMAQILNLSRSRFYQLLEQGIFPQPIYDLRTHRPMYDEKLQKACLEVKETGMGANGQYILFYSPRKKCAKAKTVKKTKNTNPLHEEFTETLNGMGLGCSVKNVSDAISQIYPNGFEGIDHGVVIRELFRFLRSK